MWKTKSIPPCWTTPATPPRPAANGAGYSHLNTDVKDGAKVAADGTNNLVYTPDDTFTGWTSYVLPHGITLGGGVRYAAGMHRGTDGAGGPPAVPKSDPGCGARGAGAGSYTVYDAMVSWAVNDHVSLRLNGYNLFDKQYVASINKSGYRYTPGAPRTFLLSADIRF
ncbi:hypothetical protein G6F31_017406 [Rhizopus arrhizus]|nr:hypothetical protein G6F31_017406 [Rhizopus arrhizus]